jgi:hypothetical protein
MPYGQLLIHDQRAFPAKAVAGGGGFFDATLMVMPWHDPTNYDFVCVGPTPWRGMILQGYH